MKTQRTLLVLALLLVGALGVLVATWSGGGARDERPAAAAPGESATATPSERGAGATPAHEGGSREAATPSEAAHVDASPAPNAPPDGFEVRAVAKGTRAPVPGAELVWWPRPAGDDEQPVFERWLAAGELEERIESGSQSFTADAAGRARVPVGEFGAMVVARSGELWGYARIDAWSEPPVSIELAKDFALRARVVDTAGKPVIGVRVALRTRADGWHEDHVLARTTAPEGIATLRHAGFVAALDPTAGERRALALAELVDPPVEAEVALDAPPAEPVELVLGPSGACEVELVDMAGRPVTEPCDVRLRFLLPDEERSQLLLSGDHDYEGEFAPHVEGGRATFEHVELGRPLVASAARVGSGLVSRALGAGPGAAGARAKLTVRVGEMAALVSGRLVDEQGLPVAATKIRARAETRDERAEVQQVSELATDAAGRFELELAPHAPEEDALDLVVFTCGGHGEELALARAPLPANMPKGTYELGDLLLQPSPLLASGTVVDAAGAPVANAWVTPSTPEPYSAPGEDVWWQELWRNRVRSDAAGRFVVRGDCKATRLSLSAEKSGLKGEPQIVPSGATGVVLALGATGAIAGVVLLDPSVPPATVSVQAYRVDGDRAGASASDDWQVFALDEHGAFAIEGLRPGRYDVRIFEQSSWDSLQEVDDVRVASGATTRDPRLDPVDLRGAFRALVFSVFDESDAPVEHGTVVTTAAGQPSTDGPRMQPLQHGQAVLVVSAAAIDVEIVAPGFLAARLASVVESQRVVLRRAPTLRFVLAAALRAPRPPFQLHLQLESLEDRSTYSSWFNESPVFDEQGVASLAAPFTGRARVVLALSLEDEQNGWSMASLAEDPPREVSISERGSTQTFEVAFDPAELAKAMKALKGDD